MLILFGAIAFIGAALLVAGFIVPHDRRISPAFAVAVKEVKCATEDECDINVSWADSRLGKPTATVQGKRPLTKTLDIRYDPDDPTNATLLEKDYQFGREKTTNQILMMAGGGLLLVGIAGVGWTYSSAAKPAGPNATSNGATPNGAPTPAS